MNRKQQEQIVYAVASGKDTYRSLTEAVPWLSEEELRYISIIPYANDPQRIIRLQETKPEADRYKFKDDDKFFLTDFGENILYEYEKEKKHEMINIICAVSSVIAAAIGIIALLLK